MSKNLKRTALCLLALAMLLLAACSSQPKTADLKKVYEQIGQQLELPEMIPLAERKIQRSYGIDTEACPQAIIAVCADGLRVDEIWLIEAADETAAEELLVMAQNRIQQICAETENYLPDQYAVAREARTLQIGNCVALFISPHAAEMEEIFRQSF